MPTPLQCSYALLDTYIRELGRHTQAAKYTISFASPFRFTTEYSVTLDRAEPVLLLQG